MEKDPIDKMYEDAVKFVTLVLVIAFSTMAIAVLLLMWLH